MSDWTVEKTFQENAITVEVTSRPVRSGKRFSAHLGREVKGQNGERFLSRFLEPYEMEIGVELMQDALAWIKGEQLQMLSSQPPSPQWDNGPSQPNTGRRDRDKRAHRPEDQDDA